MARFKYSMENILRIKERLEEQKRMDLGQAIAAYQTEVEAKDTINSQLQSYLGDFYGGQKHKTNASDLQRMSSQVAYYEKELKLQEDIVQRAASVVETKRNELKKALEERKIQEKLKENALEQYLEEEKIKEQQQLDEIVGYMYAAKREETT